MKTAPVKNMRGKQKAMTNEAGPKAQRRNKAAWSKRSNKAQNKAKKNTPKQNTHNKPNQHEMKMTKPKHQTTQTQVKPNKQGDEPKLN